MDKFVIRGGNKLKGTVSVSGAKNSSLALMPACLLNSGTNILYNTPEVNDIFTMIKLLNHLGVESSFENHKLKLDTSQIMSQDAPYEHVKKMRASVYVLGPLLAKYGYAKVSMPGGCAWGPRPINLHIESMRKLGAEVELDKGYIIAKARRLKGAKINFDVASVGATGNVMMAASLAEGNTVINNAAVEPEITQLADFLVSMGAHIDGIGTSTLHIEGVRNLAHSEAETIQDRIEAGTLLIAAAMTQGKIELDYKYPEHIETIISKLEDTGVDIKYNGGSVSIDATDFIPDSVDVSTSTFPGFPTDMQAQWIAYMSLADGSSTVTDNIYFDRFNHVPELSRLGAKIEVIKNSAVIKGVEKLRGAKVMSTDLRASASLLLGGLAAEGETEVLRIYHLDRGYERIEEKLQILGADILRVSTSEY